MCSLSLNNTEQANTAPSQSYTRITFIVLLQVVVCSFIVAAAHTNIAYTDQLFGVPLEEITRVQGAMVPQLITVGLSVIESGELQHQHIASYVQRLKCC